MHTCKQSKQSVGMYISMFSISSYQTNNNNNNIYTVEVELAQQLKISFPCGRYKDQ